MEINYSSYMSISILLLIVAFIFHRSKTNITYRRPPSPPGSLPIIGHLHLLKQPLHRSLHFLSHKHGPIMWLNFGSHPVVVVSSSEAAEECFTKNDITLANRPNHMVGKHIGYNHTTMVQAPYGDHWRNLRRIGSLEIFSSSRLNNFLAIRADEVKRLMLRLVSSSSSSNNHSKVELRGMLQDLTLNNMLRMIAGKRYYGESVGDKDEADEFKEMMVEVMGIGSGNPANFIPLLKWVGFGGFERKLIRLSKRMDAFMQKLIDDRRCILEDKNTMIDHLLSLQQSQPEYYSDQIIKGIIQIMLLAGTDTSAVTIEWAMSNLLNHPEKLKKARDEIDSKVGEERAVEESDLSKLKYIQNIISETLRLNPSAPLLVPHRSSKDFTLSSYHIPENTMLLVNAWAIHRDPRVWEDATTFKPERFENDDDGGGDHNKYKLLPFGVGRRACPGTGLAHRMVGLTLATLIHCFDWEKLDDQEIDMAEGSGLTMPKLIPLQLNCKPRRPIFNSKYI